MCCTVALFLRYYSDAAVPPALSVSRRPCCNGGRWSSAARQPWPWSRQTWQAPAPGGGSGGSTTPASWCAERARALVVARGAGDMKRLQQMLPAPGTFSPFFYKPPLTSPTPCCRAATAGDDVQWTQDPVVGARRCVPPVPRASIWLNQLTIGQARARVHMLSFFHQLICLFMLPL